MPLSADALWFEWFARCGHTERWQPYGTKYTRAHSLTQRQRLSVHSIDDDIYVSFSASNAHCYYDYYYFIVIYILFLDNSQRTNEQTHCLAAKVHCDIWKCLCFCSWLIKIIIFSNNMYNGQLNGFTHKHTNIRSTPPPQTRKDKKKCDAVWKWEMGKGHLLCVYIIIINIRNVNGIFSKATNVVVVVVIVGADAFPLYLSLAANVPEQQWARK